MRPFNLSSIFVFAMIVGSVHVYAQTRQERKQQMLEESAKVKPVKGGESILVETTYDDVYDKLLTFLKKHDEGIEEAKKETGQIASGITVEGGYKQTGTRIQFVIIKEGDKSTTIKIQVVEMKRYKALQTEPWGDPKINDEKTKKLTEEVSQYLVSR